MTGISSKQQSLSRSIVPAVCAGVAVSLVVASPSIHADVTIKPVTLELSGRVDMKDVPQIAAQPVTDPRPDMRYLTLDAAALAADKARAKAHRFAIDGPRLDALARSGGGPQTVSPPEAVFPGIDRPSCLAQSGVPTSAPDQALAVGDTLVGVLQGVRDCVSLYDKNGNLQSGWPKSTDAFFGTFGGLNNQTARMIFDWVNHRYYFLVNSFPDSCNTSCASASFYNLAVSTGDDPAGTWCLYKNIAVQTTPNPQGGVWLFPAFPRLAQDRQAIYIASNVFSDNYLGEEILALNKSQLQACAPTVSGNAFTGINAAINIGVTIQPAHVFLPSDQPKSMFFVTSYGGGNKLDVSAIHNPLSSPTFSRVTITTTNSYSTPPDATQQGTTNLIHTGDTRISATPMYAAGSIYAAITTDGGNGEPGIITYQIQPFVNTSGGADDGKIVSARILNETTYFGQGTLALFYPAQQPDGEGNVATVTGYSSDSDYASIGYLTRRASQVPGTWPDSGSNIMSGGGPYNRPGYGSYFATAPAGIVSGGGTGGFPKFWLAGPLVSTGNNWATAIARTGYNSPGQD